MQISKCRSAHIGELKVDLLVKEDLPLACQLSLKSLFSKGNKLLLRHPFKIGLMKAGLHNLSNGSI